VYAAFPSAGAIRQEEPISDDEDRASSRGARVARERRRYVELEHQVPRRLGRRVPHVVRLAGRVIHNARWPEAPVVGLDSAREHDDRDVVRVDMGGISPVRLEIGDVGVQLSQKGRRPLEQQLGTEARGTARRVRRANDPCRQRWADFVGSVRLPRPTRRRRSSSSTTERPTAVAVSSSRSPIAFVAWSSRIWAVVQPATVASS
jgi:hypothetical protein